MAAVFAVLCNITFAQTTVFEKYKNNKYVSTVFIGKTMLSMTQGAKIGGHDIGKLGSQIDRIRIIECEKRSLFAALRNHVVSDMKKNKYKVVMTASEEDEKVIIYHKTLPGNKNDFVLLTIEDDELAIINITGSVSLQDIRRFAD